MYMNVLLCMFFIDHVFKIIINCMYHVALDKYKLNQKNCKDCTSFEWKSY